jgi:hypothetical protein
MRFGTYNVRSLCRVGAIKSVVGELEKCKLDLVGVQEVRWEGDRNLFSETGLFVHNRIISAVIRVEFVSNRMSYIILKGRWCDIIVLNVHGSPEDKDDVIKDSFYE